MTRLVKPFLCCLGAIALAVVASACGSEGISVPSSSPLHNGAVLFSQRCAGCHTLSQAGTHGSASNVRTAQYNNGPNFDIRCERPIDRVLYAIENGGFSGAIMPQNIVVGQDAIDVAKFVSQYAGDKAPHIPGVTPCDQESIGTLPGQSASTGQGSGATPAASTGNSRTYAAAPSKHPAKKQG